MSIAFLRPLLVCIWGVLFVAGNARLCAQTTDRVVNEAYADAKRPTNLSSLLVNIKFLLDRDLLLREAFYTDDILQRFFGGSKIVWQANQNRSNKWGEVVAFGAMVEPLVTAGMSIGGLTLRFYRTVKNNDKVEAKLDLTFRSPKSPDFDEVQRIFGVDWRLQETLDSTHRIFRSPTGPHGNDRIIYTMKTSTLSRYFLFDFSFDETLSLADFSIEGMTPR
jgi:hypothetical protein